MRSNLAIANDYNGDHGIVSFTPDRDIANSWTGDAGPQPATGDPTFHLAGGGRQEWVPREELRGVAGAWRIAPFESAGDDLDDNGQVERGRSSR